ncbi:MAG: methyl-accepting chemotaxis protein [Hyphomicrobiales bacterium]|nr:methyl-accepting chemotaxis protein [Hyphomicrobiales bacterium]
MNLIQRLIRPFGRSIAFRWALYVVLAAGFGFAALLGVTLSEMESQLDAEGATVEVLARQKTAERMDAEIGLVQYRLIGMVQGLEDSLRAVAGFRTTQAAIRHRNDVAIAEEIGKQIVRAGFTGALVLDAELNVLGSDKTGAELVAASRALELHEFRQSFSALLRNADPAAPVAFRHVGLFDPALAAMLISPVQDEYGALVALPVFDDFGEPVALLIGFRVFERSEPRLLEFADITKSVVALVVGMRVISIAGSDADLLQFTPAGADGLLGVPDLASVGRCRETFPLLRICVVHRLDEVQRFRNEILEIGRAQFERTRQTLFSIGGLSMLIILLLLVGLGRHLTRPLSEITQAVNGVAGGEWRVEVRHTGRLDEVGQIARAVASMQVALAERDRMRQEMVRIDAINQRRLVLDAAVGRFEDSMAVVMKDITDTVRALGETNAALDEAARRAEAQVETIRHASRATASRATAVSRTTREMSKTIREIARRVRTTSGVMHQGESRARQVEDRLGEVTSAARGAEDAMNVVQSLTADIARIGLRAAMEAMAGGAGEGGYSPLSETIGALAQRAGEASELVTQALGRLGAVADGAVDAIGAVKDDLGVALREAKEISVAIEEQDAATKEIADGLGHSASALLALADSVDQLRSNLASAQEVSADFVATARRIADDARAIDGSVRAFVRDVVA